MNIVHDGFFITKNLKHIDIKNSIRIIIALIFYFIHKLINILKFKQKIIMQSVEHVTTGIQRFTIDPAPIITLPPKTERSEAIFKSVFSDGPVPAETLAEKIREVRERAMAYEESKQLNGWRELLKANPAEVRRMFKEMMEENKR